MSKRQQVKSETMQATQYCQVLGPFNSGTTLITRFLRPLLLSEAPIQDCVWKHSMPPQFFPVPSPGVAVGDCFVSLQELAPTVFICMVRLPYFWLLSTLHRRYGLRIETSELDFSARLRAPVTLRGKTFPNVVSLWNDYYRHYEEHIIGQHEALYIRLEDLVQQPRQTLLKLDHLIKPHKDIDLDAIIEKVSATPSKPGNTYGAQWKEKYQAENVRRYFSEDDLAFINETLDLRLMNKFGYQQLWTRPTIIR